MNSHDSETLPLEQLAGYGSRKESSQTKPVQRALEALNCLQHREIFTLATRVAGTQRGKDLARYIVADALQMRPPPPAPDDHHGLQLSSRQQHKKTVREEKHNAEYRVPVQPVPLLSALPLQEGQYSAAAREARLPREAMPLAEQGLVLAPRENQAILLPPPLQASMPPQSALERGKEPLLPPHMTNITPVALPGSGNRCTPVSKVRPAAAAAVAAQLPKSVPVVKLIIKPPAARAPKSKEPETETAKKTSPAASLTESYLDRSLGSYMEKTKEIKAASTAQTVMQQVLAAAGETGRKMPTQQDLESMKELLGKWGLDVVNKPASPDPSCSSAGN